MLLTYLPLPRQVQIISLRRVFGIVLSRSDEKPLVALLEELRVSLTD